jgi:hypothetical protein
VSTAANLTPFDSERAREAGRRSGEAKRARALAKRETVDDIAVGLRTLAATYRREELAPIAIGAAIDLIGRVTRGEIPVRNGSEVAELVRALVDIGRMESGDPARTVAVAHLSGPALAERLRALQATAVTTSSSAANTATDSNE